MKKILAIMLSITLMAGIFTGCSSEPKEDGGATDGDEKKPKVALLIDQAGTQVYILSMIDALKDNAEKYGYEAIIAESADGAAYESNAGALIEEGVD